MFTWIACQATWDWLCSVLDATEAQLRFGSALTETTDSSHPSHPLNPNYGRSSRERLARDDVTQAMLVDSRRRSRLPTGKTQHLEVVFCLF